MVEVLITGGAKSNLLSCNFPTIKNRNSLQLQSHIRKLLLPHGTTALTASVSSSSSSSSSCFRLSCFKTKLPSFRNNNARIVICHDSDKENKVTSDGQKRDWTTSILLFLLWAAILYYVSFLSPNQTPSRDMYFLKKLLNLKGDDDGFIMNQVLVSVWYIMGLWPLLYSMLLLPTGRSSKNNIPVWPFLLLSCFGGIYALLPYFVLWNPPPPPVQETQLNTWPLSFLESKVAALILLAAGIGIITYAGLAGEDVWKEYYQYFRESKFIHIMSIDFALLSTLAPFWVYNDMTARKWFNKGSWLLPVSLIPFLGPGLYLLLRPSLSTSAISQTPVEPK